MLTETRLDNLAIASPCTADWNAMTGDAKRRFCGDCKLHVHDLSAMTRAEATAVLQAAGEGRVCVRFYRRADGTVLTQDCPVGLRRQLRRAWTRSAALCAALLSATLGFLGCTRDKKTPPDATTPTPVEHPELSPIQGEVCEPIHMGAVAPPPMGKPELPSLTPAPQMPTTPR